MTGAAFAAIVFGGAATGLAVYGECVRLLAERRARRAGRRHVAALRERERAAPTASDRAAALDREADGAERDAILAATLCETLSADPASARFAEDMADRARGLRLAALEAQFNLPARGPRSVA